MRVTSSAAASPLRPRAVQAAPMRVQATAPMAMGSKRLVAKSVALTPSNDRERHRV